MSQFHYVRTTGVDGGVDAVDGPAIGIGLDELLVAGLPPFKQVLEIVAALCEILDIAEEDGEHHNTIGLQCVFLDDTGAVSLEYGTEGRSRAPERVPKGAPTDRYGMGYVAYRLFAGTELPELPNDDPDAHDDGVIDAIISIDLDSLPEAIVGDIQWFLGKFMSYEPDERPPALDAWRSFIAFADTVSGDALEDWSRVAVDGGGQRRTAAERVEMPDEELEELPPSEDLGGVQRSAGPLSRGAIDFSGGKSSGQATAFWSRDAMKAALEGDDDDDDGFRPAVGGGSSTAFWSREQMAAMATGGSEAPRPKRGAGKATERTAQRSPPGPAPAPAPQPAKRPSPPPAPQPSSQQQPSKYHAPTRPPSIDENDSVQAQPGGGWRPDQPSEAPSRLPKTGRASTTFMAPPQRAPAPGTAPSPPPPNPAIGNPVIGGPVPGGPVIGGPVIGGPIAGGPVANEPGMPSGMPQPMPIYDDDELDEGGSNLPLIIGAVVLLGALLCGGLTVAGGGYYFLFGGGSSSTTPMDPSVPAGSIDTAAPAAEIPPPAAIVEPAVEPEPATAAPAPRPAPAARPSPAPAARPSPSPAPSLVRPSSVRPSPRPAPVAEPEPAFAGPVTVVFRSRNRATIACGDGQSEVVDGSLTMSFDGALMPVSCVIQESETGRAAVYIPNGGTVACSGRGNSFACSGP